MASPVNALSPIQRKGLVLILCFVVAFLLLGLMRNAVKDEALYLQETQLMSRCLQEGAWFGNEPVGVHGFLFKLPAALVFLLTGPSVGWATAINVLFAGLALWIFFLLQKRIWGDSIWPWLGSFLLLFSYHFLRLTPTFLREIPALMVLMLLLYLLTTGRGWLPVGLVLMLLLDAKESVFVMVVPGYVLWVLVSAWRGAEGKSTALAMIRGVTRIGVVLIPALVYLVLMFTTGVVPLNPKVSYILGLNEGGWRTFLHKNVTPQRAGMNVLKGGRQIFQLGARPYGWRVGYNGSVTLASEWVGEEKWPVVKLEKPAVRSSAPDGIFHHWAWLWPEPKHLNQGEVIVYALWYKTTSRSANTLVFTNKEAASGKWVGSRDVRLDPDGNWHYISVPVPVVKAGPVSAGIGWRSGSGTVLYVAGCRAERGNWNRGAADTGDANRKQVSGTDHKKKVEAPHRGIGGLERIKRWAFGAANLTLTYIGKIFYPATFSLAGVPRFLIFFAMLMSFPLFKRWFRENRIELICLPLFFWVSIVAYIFRWSLGRYLMPFFPLILIFFLFFLKEGLSRPRFARNGIAAAMVFVALGLVFETRYMWVKVVLNVVIFAGLWILFRFRGKNNNRFERWLPGFVAMLAVVSAGTALATSIMLPGQIGRWLSHGTHSQYDVIAAQFEEGEKVWINTNAHLLRFYRKEPYLSFTRGKFHFNLKPWVRKSRLLNRERLPWTHHFRWQNDGDLEGKLRELGTARMALVVSNKRSGKYRFPMQHRKADLDRLPFLKMERAVTLKNKTLYLYRVL